VRDTAQKPFRGKRDELAGPLTRYDGAGVVALLAEIRGNG